LLAYAFNRHFTGALVLELAGRSRSGVFFEAGGVSRARAADMEQSLARQVLEESELSNESLVTAARFARESGRDVFTAVDHLALLPPARLEQAKAAFVERQVQALTALPPDTAYGFFPELDTLKKLPGPSKPLATLNLIVTCILREPSIERCRRHLEPFKNERLVLMEHGSLDLGSLVSSARTVCARLMRAPHSLEDLRLLNLVEEHELIACIYALRLTRRVVREGNASSRPSWPSRVPRSISSQALRAASTVGGAGAAQGQNPRDTLPEVGYTPSPSLPPLSESEAPKRRLTKAEQNRYWQEQNAESKTLEAWAMAEGGDATQIEKATFVVEKAVKFFPANPRIRFYAGCVYQRAGRLDEAAAEFRRVLSIDPDNTEAKRELELLTRRSGGPPPPKGVFGRLLKKR